VSVRKRRAKKGISKAENFLRMGEGKVGITEGEFKQAMDWWRKNIIAQQSIPDMIFPVPRRVSRWQRFKWWMKRRLLR